MTFLIRPCIVVRSGSSINANIVNKSDDVFVQILRYYCFQVYPNSSPFESFLELYSPSFTLISNSIISLFKNAFFHKLVMHSWMFWIFSCSIYFTPIHSEDLVINRTFQKKKKKKKSKHLRIILRKGTLFRCFSVLLVKLSWNCFVEYPWVNTSNKETNMSITFFHTHFRA